MKRQAADWEERIQASYLKSSLISRMYKNNLPELNSKANKQTKSQAKQQLENRQETFYQKRITDGN